MPQQDALQTTETPDTNPRDGAQVRAAHGAHGAAGSAGAARGGGGARAAAQGGRGALLRASRAGGAPRRDATPNTSGIFIAFASIVSLTQWYSLLK